MPPIVCSAQASYKKLPGLLELTDSHLQWTKAGDKTPSVRVPHAEAACKSRNTSFNATLTAPPLHILHLICVYVSSTALSRSKVGAAQVRLKVGLFSDEAGHNFTFTSPQAIALAERDKFEVEVTNIIARNRSGAPATVPSPIKPIPPHVAATTSGPASPIIPHGAAGTPMRPPPPISRPSTSRAASVVSERGGSVTPFGNDATGDFRLRKKVLLSTPELAQLHREMVLGGHITENEFWEGREVNPIYCPVCFCSV